MKLYYHITDGRAEYLCSKNVEGTTEGSLNSKYVIRIDGDIRVDAELMIKEEICSTCGETGGLHSDDACEPSKEDEDYTFPKDDKDGNRTVSDLHGHNDTIIAKNNCIQCQQTN